MMAGDSIHTNLISTRFEISIRKSKLQKSLPKMLKSVGDRGFFILFFFLGSDPMGDLEIVLCPKRFFLSSLMDSEIFELLAF